ncbi:hypothetical protein [Gracilimonas tropica]|uniref:hypothetical protein n=1 Tax=Gracilimonas tropica TaxID=454600 RepID=UPI000368AC9E|nr:hypothetical protein [Gracilimonas tropica]
MSKFFTPFSVLLMLLLFGSCTRNDDQREFEQQAYGLPSGFTETTNQGQVVEADPDDWRTSPLFQGLIEIVPVYPNPATTSQAVQFEVEVTGVQSVTGLEVMTRFPDNTFRSLYQDFGALDPGLTTFQINPLEFAQFGNPEGARGLNRVFVFDARGQMISYGDIMVE